MVAGKGLRLLYCPYVYDTEIIIDTILYFMVCIANFNREVLHGGQIYSKRT